MKAYLFLIAIVSVMPVFFAFIFIHGTRNRLVALRDRCATAPEPHRARDEYDSARRAFPGSLVARMFVFGPVPAGDDPQRPNN